MQVTADPKRRWAIQCIYRQAQRERKTAGRGDGNPSHLRSSEQQPEAREDRLAARLSSLGGTPLRTYRQSGKFQRYPESDVVHFDVLIQIKSNLVSLRGTYLSELSFGSAVCGV